MVFSTDNEKFVLLYHLQNATFWKLNYFDISKNMDVDGKIQKEGKTSPFWIIWQKSKKTKSHLSITNLCLASSFSWQKSIVNQSSPNSFCNPEKDTKTLEWWWKKKKLNFQLLKLKLSSQLLPPFLIELRWQQKCIEFFELLLRFSHKIIIILLVADSQASTAPLRFVSPLKNIAIQYILTKDEEAQPFFSSL